MFNCYKMPAVNKAFVGVLLFCFLFFCLLLVVTQHQTGLVWGAKKKKTYWVLMWTWLDRWPSTTELWISFCRVCVVKVSLPLTTLSDDVVSECALTCSPGESSAVWAPSIRPCHPLLSANRGNKEFRGSASGCRSSPLCSHSTAEVNQEPLALQSPLLDWSRALSCCWWDMGRPTQSRVGRSPQTLTLVSGKHVVRIRMNSFNVLWYKYILLLRAGTDRLTVFLCWNTKIF